MKISRRAPEAISGQDEKKASGCGNLGCALFSVPFFLAGAAVLYIFLAGPALKVYRAKDWNPTPCEIISSRVDSHDDTYAVKMRYSYMVEGRRYESDRYGFFSGSTSGYEGKAEVVRQNPPGQRATCYVNPSDPADAVFDRDFSSDMMFGLIGLPFLVVGAGGLLLIAHGYIKGRKGLAEDRGKPIKWSPPAFNPTAAFNAASFPNSPAANSAADVFQSTSTSAILSPAHPTWASPGGRVVLEPSTTPGCRLAALLAFALFWNGIVSIFVWALISQWREGNFEWFLAIFLIPFVLVGIGVIVAAAHTFLALFNPRPRLTIDSHQLRLGEAFDLEWEFSRSTSSVNRLQIFLEGREEATYRRGTTTTTDKSVFATVKVTDRPGADRGRAQVTIPGDTMHSFKSDNNKIVWAIQVKGDIRFWSDIDESFQIEVLPKRLQRAAEL